MLPDRLSERQAVAGGFSHLIFHLPKHRSDLRPDLWCLAGSGCAGYGTGVGGWVCKLGLSWFAPLLEKEHLCLRVPFLHLWKHIQSHQPLVFLRGKRKKRQARNVSREDVGCHPKELIGLQGRADIRATKSHSIPVAACLHGARRPKSIHQGSWLQHPSVMTSEALLGPCWARSLLAPLSPRRLAWCLAH